MGAGENVGCGVGESVGETVAEGITVAGTVATAVAEATGIVTGAAVDEAVGAAERGVVVGALARAGDGDTLACAGAAAQIWSSDMAGGATLFPHAHPSTAPSET